MPRAKDGANGPARVRSFSTRQTPYERIRAAILSGEFTPGQPLVENALAEWCGVSRTPVREALRRLQQDGLLDRTERGMTVRERSPAEILDIYDTRLALEAMAGRVAAERRTDLDLRSIRSWLERGRKVKAGDDDGMVVTNQGFHGAIWRAAHNESLIDLLERLNLHLARYPGTTLAFPGRWDEARAEHEQLLDAIERRDSQAAHDIAMKHFVRARDIRLDLFGDETGQL